MNSMSGPQGCERVENIVVGCVFWFNGLPYILSYAAKSLLDQLQTLHEPEF